MSLRFRLAKYQPRALSRSRDMKVGSFVREGVTPAAVNYVRRQNFEVAAFYEFALLEADNKAV